MQIVNGGCAQHRIKGCRKTSAAFTFKKEKVPLIMLSFATLINSDMKIPNIVIKAPKIISNIQEIYVIIELKEKF
jgi:hypothetical protein